MDNKDITTAKRLKEIIDELASGNDYITYKDILSYFFEKKIDKPSAFKEFQSLKNIISGAKSGNKDLFDYRNGRDASNGFKYKKGHEFHFRKMSEKSHLDNLSDEEKKKLFVTGGLQMLFGDETISEPYVDFECIKELTNINLVTILYKRIVWGWVISFNYNKGYRGTGNVIVHPHLLKEYNSRWFLFGYVQDTVGEPLKKIAAFSLDRMDVNREDDIQSHPEIKYEPAPRNFYNDYFKDIVGVSKPEGSEPEIITIRTTNYKVHKLILTKPIHPSQKEIKPFAIGGDSKNAEEGTFTIEVIPNNELQTRILSYGSGVYIAGNGDFAKKLKRSIAYMVKNYLQ